MASRRWTTVATNCLQCGSEFQVKPCLLADGKGKYCGQPCFVAARAAKRPELVCPSCGGKFVVKPHMASDGSTRYCSRSCANAGESQNRIPISDRFWPKVRKGSQDDCWLWQGGTTKRGYGVIGGDGKGPRQLMASRVAWELTHGPIIDGLFVCHDCPDGDNPLCVNPAHLFLGTQQDNMDDKVKKGRQRKGEGVPSSKLKESDVIRIKDIHRAGETSVRKLAETYGVTTSTIRSIMSGRLWKHIP